MKTLRSAGFTLMEIMVAITLIAILILLVAPAVGSLQTQAHQAQCTSNLRQIGLALHLYTQDHNGSFPPTTHTTGSYRKEESWIYGLASYLDNVDQVRVCPADPPERRAKILQRKATSYALNELVFDQEKYRRVYGIPRPSKTILAVILSENRTPSTGWDHVHSAQWHSWQNILNDVEVDRHRSGARAGDRLSGSANYLYADAHVANLTAAEIKKRADAGENPGDVPP